MARCVLTTATDSVEGLPGVLPPGSPSDGSLGSSEEQAEAHTNSEAAKKMCEIFIIQIQFPVVILLFDIDSVEGEFVFITVLLSVVNAQTNKYILTVEL